VKGTFVNVAAVLLGGGLGLLVGHRLPERLRGIITDGLGLATILIGLRLALKADNMLIVQGGLTLLGGRLAFLLDERILNEVTGTGGALILGIGLLLLEIRRLRIANFLPALPIAAALATLFR